VIEDVLRFGDPPLAGVLCRPDVAGADLPGVVLLSPGLLHRVGPNRLYVRLARALAADGFSVLRFDFSGQGDSPPRADHLPLRHSAIAETRAAIDRLVAGGCSRVLLIGHCSGAVFSFLTAFEDERVAGVIAISPEGGDEGWVEFDRRQKEARYYANYYGRGALHDASRWKRLLTGRANYRSITRNVLRNVVWYRLSTLAYRFRSASGTSAKAAAERPDVQVFKDGLRSLAGRRVPILLIHPDQSAGRELLRALLGDIVEEMHAAGELDVALIRESDHMFTPLAAQRDLIETIGGWARAAASPSTAPVMAAGGPR
jgi:pimeloyl-ACP methyl ester carboxylesterase